MIEDWFEEYAKQKCGKCNNDTFQVAFLGTPTTPASIMTVVMKCVSCGNMTTTDVDTAIAIDNCDL